MSTSNPYQSPEPFDQQPALSPFAGGNLPYASRWLRLGGAILDSLIVGVPAIAAAFLLGLYEFRPDGSLPLGNQILLILLGIAVFLAINARLIYTRGQTVGKMICGTMVVMKDGRVVSGNRYIFARLLPIWIITQIPYIGGLFGLADALAIFRSERNCLHDDIAGTRVVDVRSG